MIKRFTALTLTLLLLTGVCLPAQASSIATLDQALSRWMDAQTDVRFSATLQLKTLMPFDEANVALLNGVLKHVSAEATIHQEGSTKLFEQSKTNAMLEPVTNGTYSWVYICGGIILLFGVVLLIMQIHNTPRRRRR